VPRKPKRLVTLDLPRAFTEFMQHVDHLISIGDPRTTMESDDLLQCDRVYGGLYDRAGRRFGFRYFHGEKATWEFDLSAQEIADIASGRVTQVSLWQCSGGKCGCYYAAEDAYCPHCDSLD
jgi:hypothetical protein